MDGFFFEPETGVKATIRTYVILVSLWAAWRTGKAAAERWSDCPLIIAYTVLIDFFMQLLHHALFERSMLNIWSYAEHTLLKLAINEASDDNL
ncbi:DUF6867 family protein [Agrobacterium fabrum]|uniref:DUF6867 family protein n=1 Tax=Agrobacterium fabrum TaxID=1176649 RepID=UPI003BA0FA6F